MKGKGLQALLAGALTLGAAGSMDAMASEPVVEVVVYKAKGTNNFEDVRKKAHALISQKAGFVGSARLKHFDEPDTYADLVVWNGLENAHAAAAAVERESEFLQFQQSINSVTLFRHYDLSVTGHDLLNRVAKMPVVELAAYEARDGKAQSALQREIHTALKGKPGFVEGLPLAAANNQREMLDLVGWTTPQANHDAATAMQADQKHAPFFEGIQTLHFFGLFKLSE